ncbi:MAG: nucleotidyl transferase AbiEii/AbiGii toxin family protein [bacterium]
MLDLKQIEAFYPDHLKPFKRNIMREYLQYKVLSVIFDSKFGHKLAFMGGTALRIIYDHNRFSEDLDFDNLGLDRFEFGQMTDLIKRKLEQEGYIVEIKNVFKGAYRCYLKINKVLYDLGLSGYKEEKLLIQIDTEPQNFNYEPTFIILNKFDVFLRIRFVPIDILLSQKLYAILHRKRSLGRDFYDTVFLFGRAKPNFKYLQQKISVKDIASLKKKMLLKCKTLDFKRLTKDVEAFLFNPDDIKKILYFTDFINGLQ